MKWKDIIVLSFKNILRNKQRSFLTMLGIIIGVMAVVLVMSIGAGAQSLIINQITARGTDQIAVMPGASDPSGPPAQVLGIVVTTLTYDDGLALLNKNNVPYIRDMTAYVSGNNTLLWQNHSRQVTYTGTTPSYKAIERVTMSSGRFFDKAEFHSNAHVMVLGPKIAIDIFGNENPIGQTVRLAGKNFKVIGIAKAKGAAGFENPDESVIIPLFVAQRELLGIHYVSFLRLRVKDAKYVPESVNEIIATLKSRHNGDEDFSVRNVADLLSIVKTITNALKFFLVAVAGIALFVGGVGIMNTMLIAVKEKTREIGLRKAVGAKDSDILIQFLSETTIITFTGSVIGLFFGISISFLIAYVVQSLGYEYSFIISIGSVIVGFVVALLIGLIFGLIPAKQAARLHPIDALRYE